jgi:vacuolar iron transporter family protein
MQHIEQHFSGSDTVCDVVISMADGLTAPFALTAGIPGALRTAPVGRIATGVAHVIAKFIA